MFPITERSNVLTRNLDVVGSRGIVRLLRQCDTQIFAGWEEWTGLSDAPTLDNLEALADAILPQIRARTTPDQPCNVKFIMSGAGTSGRLAFYCARNLNKISNSVHANIRFEYLMAGHDLALIKSQEKAEDDVVQSIQDLKKITDDDEACTFAVYIGITCGMSAPYVGSQIDWILNASHPARISYVTAILGFNTVESTRKTPIENFPKTMYDVVHELLTKVGTDSRHFILNPIIGPEPVAGSSRMKGGSATKIILEMIAARVLHRAFPEALPLSFAALKADTSSVGHASASSFMSFIDFFERVNRWTYLSEAHIAEAVTAAGEALKSGGHLYYLGEDSIAMLALIDASECPPTYGAAFQDVRGFVPGGWATMGNMEGDMSHHGIYYQISDLDFESTVLPTATERDMLVVLHEASQPHHRLLSLLNKTIQAAPNVNIALISWSSDLQPQPDLWAAASKTGGSKILIPVKLPHFELLPGLLSPVEISAKWILNAISTGAHVLKGKVWSNRMIDLNLSNDKLFRRGIALVSSLLSVTELVAQDAILRSIHRVSNVTDDIRAMPISQHYQTATKLARVVPIALLLASGKCATVAEAELALSKDTILRNIVADLVPGSKENGL